MNRFRADVILLFVALIWGSGFVVQRVAARYYDAFTFNGLRFILGGLVLLPFISLNPKKQPNLRFSLTSAELRKTTTSFFVDRKSLIFVLLAGSLLFGAAGLQQVGLKTTTAGNAGFITTLYVVLVPIILLVFWREKLHWMSWVSAGLAIIGSLLLSTAGSFQIAKGDAFEFAGALFWALHMIVVSRAVKHMQLLTFSTGQYLVAGVLNLLVSFGLHSPSTGLAFGWWTVLYIGLLSTAVGYTLQGLGQKYAPPTDATILLSMEAVFAALIGYLFLAESMKLVQLFGCGIIFTAVVITQMKSIRMNSRTI